MLNRHGRVLIALLIALLVVLVIWLLPVGGETAGLKREPFAWEPAGTVTPDQIQGYIERWLTAGCSKRVNKAGREACRTVALNQKRGRRAPALSKVIVDTARERGLDPYVISVVVAFESSFNEKVHDGSVGERGLMQVHGLALTQARQQGYDLNTSAGQLAAGSDYLARCSDRCGPTLLGTLSAYQSGRCSTKATGPKLRTRRVRAERASHVRRLVARLDIDPRNM